MTARIFAGGHEFTQTTVSVDDRGRPSKFLWTCQRCDLAIDPSAPFVECTSQPRDAALQPKAVTQ